VTKMRVFLLFLLTCFGRRSMICPSLFAERFSDIDFLGLGCWPSVQPPLYWRTSDFLSGFTPLVPVFVSPRDRVAQLYPQAQGTIFSRLLRHARATVGLFFLPVTIQESSSRCEGNYKCFYLEKKPWLS
jgi:hypothetical protein